MRTKTSNQTLLFSALLAILLTAPISNAQAQVVTNSIGMKLQPMAIEVGSPLGHFSVGVYEVTQEQYEKVIGTNPSRFKDKKQNPVENVSWAKAMEFCRKLSELPAEKNAGHVYRLPTPEEWEYACRAGTKTKYSFGDDDSKLSDFAWYLETSQMQGTSAVGLKKPNPWGLYDMYGNVAEWIMVERDDWDPNKAWRSHHGGSWQIREGNFGMNLTKTQKNYTSGDTGFRIVREPLAQATK
ncbi:MAG: sulfatase activating formylglycine-generating enzyme [Mariniblastus sp.]|jgi:formylglycine-generating enzyme required for sulfatase activity